MMKNDICYLVEDLIPSYIDEVVSEESRKYIDEHVVKCESCRKKLDAMRGDIAGVDVFKGSEDYDKELLKKVSDKVKKKNNRSKYIAIGSVVCALLLIAVIFMPIIPINSKDLKVDVTVNTKNHGFNIYNFENAGNYKYWASRSEKTLLLSLPDEDMDKTVYQRLCVDGANDMLIAVSENYELDVINVVRLTSNSYIKRYKTDVIVDKNGNVEYEIKGVKTSIAGLLLSDKNSESSVVLLDFNHIDSVTVKNGLGSKDVVWTAE